MKKIFLLNTLLVVAVIFGSCGKCCKKDGDKADCSGIETTITLNADDSYSETSKYLNADSTEVKEEGTYHFCSKRNVATLVSSKNDTTRFAFEGNQIVLLGADGKKAEGELAEHYILKKK